MSPERLKLVKDLLATPDLRAVEAAKCLFQLDGYYFVDRGDKYMSRKAVIKNNQFFVTDRDAMSIECQRLENLTPA